LLLRDIQRDEDPNIAAIISVIQTIDPDILLLTDFDYDADHLALGAFAQALGGYTHTFTTEPNTGQATGLDLDENGYLGDARDAMAYGRFAGDGGMAILSRFSIGKVTDLSATLWRDVPGATLPIHSQAEQVYAIQRLSNGGHWIVPVTTPDGPLSLLAFSASPPVFDGPEDRNGLRNRDELRMWNLVLDGYAGETPAHFVIAGNANLDPVDGDGYAEDMAAFLADPRLQDPQPASEGAMRAADPDHLGNPAHDTADWPDTRPGNLRVSYVLPAATWTVIGAGVFWPAPDDPLIAILGDDGLLAGPHRLVWADITR
jgi:hypothetical protein